MGGSSSTVGGTDVGGVERDVESVAVIAFVTGFVSMGYLVGLVAMWASVREVIDRGLGPAEMLTTVPWGLPFWAVGGLTVLGLLAVGVQYRLGEVTGPV